MYDLAKMPCEPLLFGIVNELRELRSQKNKWDFARGNIKDHSGKGAGRSAQRTKSAHLHSSAALNRTGLGPAILQSCGKCAEQFCFPAFGRKNSTLQAPEVSMSGHSKWATIKHKKGALDAKRGKIFTRLIKEITIAARAGGGDPDGNPRLRTAVAAAKAENMPADNIKRAIQRGTGEIPGLQYEEISFEGYGPGGVAIIVDCTTDNRNRAVSEIRHAFSRNGGNLGEPNSVRFMFAKKGLIAIPKNAADEDKLMGIVLEAGGDDLNDEGDTWEIITDPNAYEGVAQAVKDAGIETVMSEVTMVATTYTKLEGAPAAQCIRLLEALEDHDDVQNVYSNFDMDAKQLEEVAG